MDFFGEEFELDFYYKQQNHGKMSQVFNTRCLNFFFFYSIRPDVNECLNHKWLREDQISIINVQNLNVTITTIPLDNVSFGSDAMSNDEEEDDDSRETSLEPLDNYDELENIENQKISTIVQHHIARLEKSASISLFPDAPTTPKVSRRETNLKIVYDEEVCRGSPCDENNYLIPVPST